MKELTLKENLMLSPIEKHILYNKFPTRLFLNIILVVLVTIQVTFIFSSTAAYPRSAERTFRYLFLGSTDDQSLEMRLNSPVDIQNQLLRVQDVFMNLETHMFQDIGPDTQFSIHAYYKYPYERKEVHNINISEGINNPFQINNIDSIKNFFGSVVQTELTMTNLTTLSYIEQTQKELCLNWTVTILYNLEETTQIKTTVSSQSVLCSASMVPGSDASVGVSILVLVFSVISLIRISVRVFKIGKVFLELKTAYINYINHNLAQDLQKWEQQKQELIDTAGANVEEKMEHYFRYQSWEDIPFAAKLGLFDGWFLFNALGNLFQVTSSMLLILSYFAPVTAQGFYIAQFVLGFSVFCSWIQLAQYMGFWKDLILITTTLRRVATPLIVFFAISIPIFLGLAILGYTLFWKYQKFNSIGQASLSLFSISCGDSVHEAFKDLWNEGLPGSIYLIVYTILYYTVFTNIFVAIVMEGFLKSRLRKKIDKDDPFPSADTLTMERKTSLEIPQRAKEDQPRRRPQLLKSLSMELGDPKLSANTKNTLNLLLFQNEEVKAELRDLLKINYVIEKRNYDKGTKQFLNNLLKTQVAKIIKKITYYEFLFKRSMESRIFEDEVL